MLSVPNVEEALFKNDFAPTAIDKGRRYASQGRVLNSNITIKGEVLQINARVSGKEKHPYEVKVTIETEGDEFFIEGECTCPVSFNCKHVVAAITAATMHVPGGSKGRTTLARIEPADTDAILSPVLDRWVESLKPTHLSPSSPEKISKQELRFVLNLAQDFSNPLLHLTLFRSTLKNNGTFGKPAPCNVYGRPDAVLSQDILAQDGELVRELFGEFGFNSILEMRGAYAPTLLRKMLATGRCFWKQAVGTPLTLSPPRPGNPVWRQRSDGFQETAFDVTPPASIILPLSPLWYLDVEAHLCGPLDVEGDPQIALRWLSAPVVQPEQSAALVRSVAALPLPAPRKIEIRHIRNIKPIAILRLHQVKFPKERRIYLEGDWNVLPRRTMDVASIEFEYDGIRVSSEDQNEFIIKNGAALERIHRMKRAEAKYVDDFSNSGLEPAESLIRYSMPKELEGTYFPPQLAAWPEWISGSLDEARKRGWRVEIDDSFPFRPVEVEQWYSETEGGGSGEDWFSYELGIVVEGQRLNLLPMMTKIIAALNQEGIDKEKLQKIAWTLEDGRIVQLPVERLRAIAATFAELFDPDAVSDGKLRVSRLRAAELLNLNDDTIWRGPDELRELATRLKAFNGIARAESPAGLQATLRPYQSEGLSWLQFLREHSFGGILADDMGLGKTVQAIAHVMTEKNAGRAAGPSLVIAPTSLMGNWRAEAEKFAPDLKVLILHGGGRKERFDEIAAHDLIVTSYALLPRDREILQKHAFHLLILDEAQYIKNPRTQWAEIVRALSAKHRLCMTGTPMENHLGELWSLMHFLSPGYLGSEKQFRRIYRDPIEKVGDKDRRSALAKRIRPFLMRRRKEDVATELPEKTEIIRNVELDGRQRDLYETIRLAMHERVKAEVAAKGMSRSHIIILDALLKLRQVCCDPRLVKLDRARQVKESAKLDLLRDMLPEMIGEGRRVLLFSQFTSMLDLIEETVNALNIPFVRISGDTSDRETPVRRFQNREVPLFLISLKAGGIGLNLTAADTVIHYDPWWNPAVERQATDRAHRIGQDKAVFVYKLVTAGTVEEKILAMQERKKELVAGLLGEGAQENLALTKADLDHLFDPVG